MKADIYIIYSGEILCLKLLIACIKAYSAIYHTVNVVCVNCSDYDYEYLLNRSDINTIDFRNGNRWHHAEALNSLIAQTNDKYMLFMHPDLAIKQLGYDLLFDGADANKMACFLYGGSPTSKAYNGSLFDSCIFAINAEYFRANSLFFHHDYFQPTQYKYNNIRFGLDHGNTMFYDMGLNILLCLLEIGFFPILNKEPWDEVFNNYFIHPRFVATVGMGDAAVSYIRDHTIAQIRDIANTPVYKEMLEADVYKYGKPDPLLGVEI